MKTLHITIISLVCISVMILSSTQTYGIPYVSPPARYFNSDIVLIGKVISSAPFSPDHTKYEIKVEQYLKNPQSQDTITVIAPGTNKTVITADTVFDIGQRVFLYLKKDQDNYTVWWYSHPTDSLCDPAPSATDMNFTHSKGIGLDYQPLHVGASKSNSYLYAVNQPVVITYDAWSNQFTTKTFDVVFEVKNQTGQILFNDTKQAELKPCIGHQIVNSTFIPKVAGTYEVDVIFDNSLTGTTVEIPTPVTGTRIGMTHASPLQQFKSGIVAKDVQCNYGFTLVMKAEDGSPACVKPDTGNILVKRGWAEPIAGNIIQTSKESIRIIPEFPITTGINKNGTITDSETIEILFDNFKQTSSPLIIQIFNPQGGVYRVDNIPANDIQSDGFYKYQIYIKGNHSTTGQYKVMTIHGNATASIVTYLSDAVP